MRTSSTVAARLQLSYDLAHLVPVSVRIGSHQIRHLPFVCSGGSKLLFSTPWENQAVVGSRGNCW